MLYLLGVILVPPPNLWNDIWILFTAGVTIVIVVAFRYVNIDGNIVEDLGERCEYLSTEITGIADNAESKFPLLWQYVFCTELKKNLIIQKHGKNIFPYVAGISGVAMYYFYSLPPMNKLYLKVMTSVFHYFVVTVAGVLLIKYNMLISPMKKTYRKYISTP